MRNWGELQVAVRETRMVFAIVGFSPFEYSAMYNLSRQLPRGESYPKERTFLQMPSGRIWEAVDEDGPDDVYDVDGSEVDE